MTTMYLPRHFEENDRKRIIPLIREYPFATLICVSEGAPVINHLPIIPQRQVQVEPEPLT